MEFSVPVFKKPAFNCPFCNAYAHMQWDDLVIDQGQFLQDTCFVWAQCSHCHQSSCWHIPYFAATTGSMIYPSIKTAPQPHPEMPKEVTNAYQEAREVFDISPRSAAALLRLVVQELMPILGQKGKNINDDIGSLVAEGLPVEVQQALDICRVIGNNAVHPGTIDLSENTDVAMQLFHLVNFIIEDRIARPKKIAELYGSLPEGARQAIQKRDQGVGA